MTEANRSMDDVYALLDEQRRYEAWLAALDERRETTPAHVFERVHADYRGRLKQVADRLAGHRQTIEDERNSVASRLSLLGAEEQMRRDERAELELRAHVGELAEPDAESAFGAVDDAIAKLGAERGQLEKRVEDLNALLANQPDRAPADSPGDAPGSFDELAFLDAVVGEGTSSAAAPDEANASEPVVAKQEPPVQPAKAPAPAKADALPAAYEQIVTADDSDAESLLAGLGTSRRSSASPPLAANVPSNTPIVLRASGSQEHSKTLKCNECGAMNYPTEWYCERCGAELAAL